MTLADVLKKINAQGLMKKILIIFILAIMLMLSGCGVTYENRLATRFWIDKDTGVYYVVNNESICPRYNADGTLYTG